MLTHIVGFDSSYIGFVLVQLNIAANIYCKQYFRLGNSLELLMIHFHSIVV